MRGSSLQRGITSLCSVSLGVVVIVCSLSCLAGKSTAVLTATVRDNLGNPMPNQSVRIGVEGDGQVGTISGEEVITGITDGHGQFSAVFTSGEVYAVVGVRAELLYDHGVGIGIVDHDRKEIIIGTRIYLPLSMR